MSQSLSARQRGAALIVALVFLMVMTVVSVASMRGTTIQERMVGNMQDRNAAFQAAEAELREAEQWLLANETNRNIADDSTARVTDGTWNGATNPAPTGSRSAIESLATDPVFHVGKPHLVRVDMADPAAGVCSVYPVASLAVGRSDTTVVSVKTNFEYVCDR